MKRSKEDNMDSHMNCCGSILTASSLGHLKCLKAFVNAEVDLNEMLGEGSGALLLRATDNGNADIVQFLTEIGADVNYMDEVKFTPLMHATQEGHHECVKLLIDAGADVNLKGYNKKTPVLIAAANGVNKCLELLIEAGADVNITNHNGFSGLHLATYYGNKKCVKLLAEAGADVNGIQRNETPLMYASENGRSELVEILLKAGADVNIINNTHGTSLMLATKQGHEKCVKLLVDAGADVNICNTFKNVLLNALMCNQKPNCLKVLLKAGARTDGAIDTKTIRIIASKFVIPVVRDVTMLLYAARLPLDEAIIEHLNLEEAGKRDLKSQCRCVIRKHLLEMNPGDNLLWMVRRLGFPALLSAYLTYHV